VRALRIYAGPQALSRLREWGGLRPQNVGAVPAAAGGPKGLTLLRIDQHLFGEWLPQGGHHVQLVGASIGAWRMATACLDQPVQALHRLEHDYIHQHFEPTPPRRRPSAQQVSEAFARSLQAFYGGRTEEVLNHPRWHLNIVVSQGQSLLRQGGQWRTPVGFAGAYLANALGRRYLSAWLQRGILSADMAQASPLVPDGLPTQRWALSGDNFMAALQASCSIPFAMQPVHDIQGAPAGAYWDGGLTDYHLHWRFAVGAEQVVLYPHFQQAVVPGWLDKLWRQRHAASAALDNMVVLAPSPEWVASLPNGKLPDRHDFVHYANDFQGRVKAWQRVVNESQRLSDEWQTWLNQPDWSVVSAL
jgi:hypothetical protein